MLLGGRAVLLVSAGAGRRRRRPGSSSSAGRCRSLLTVASPRADARRRPVRRVGATSDGDVEHAAALAAACGSYRRDDEDEDPLDGAVNCFGCRFRRWVPDGFTCLKGLLAGVG